MPILVLGILGLGLMKWLADDVTEILIWVAVLMVIFFVGRRFLK